MNDYMCTDITDISNVSPILKEMNDNKKIIGIDIGQQSLFTFSDPILIRGHYKDSYSINNDKFVGLVTWCKEHPQEPNTEGYREWKLKIKDIIKERKIFIETALNEIFDENNIEVVVIEHDLYISQELVENGWADYIRAKNKNDIEGMHQAWKRYTKGLTSMMDYSQFLIKKVCQERGIMLIQTEKGWISTYRCSRTGKTFSRADWLTEHNNYEKIKHGHDFMFNRSVHKINDKVRDIILRKPSRPDYELAKMIANQEITIHNNTFVNEVDKLKRVTITDIRKAKFNEKGYLDLIPDRDIDVNFAGYNTMCRVRVFTCPVCGQTHNRDINAAINIKQKGIEIITIMSIHIN